MEAEYPRRQAIFVALQAVDQFVDGRSFVDIDKVSRQVADEEGHHDGEEDGGQASFLLHADLA